MFVNITVSVILALVLSGAILYVIREKKKGIRCVGCPYANQCGQTKCSCEKPKNVNE